MSTQIIASQLERTEKEFERNTCWKKIESWTRKIADQILSFVAFDTNIQTRDTIWLTFLFEWIVCIYRKSFIVFVIMTKFEIGISNLVSMANWFDIRMHIYRWSFELLKTCSNIFEAVPLSGMRILCKSKRLYWNKNVDIATAWR